MNQTELLQVVIANAVEKGVREGLEKELKPLKEELRQIKALNAKILKEQANLVVSSPDARTNWPSPVTHQTVNNLNEQFRDAKQEEAAMNILKSQAAPFLKADGHLPDVDIPIGLFLKKGG